MNCIDKFFSPMSRQIVIHPGYSGLRDFITRLPDIFLHEGEYLHDGRNKIKIFDVRGLKLNVKRYRIPILFNRFVYLYLRKTKAERAYAYALRLQKTGILTPAPVAYIIEKKGLLLGYSYFVSIQVGYSRRFYEFGHAALTEEHVMILKEFGRYTARLHRQNVCHQDYSPGNILFDLKNGKPEFCIVDINRMYFGPVSFKKGCANFARLWGSPEMFRIMAAAYAEERGWDVDKTCREVLKARKEHWRKVARKRKVEFPLEF